MFLDEHSTASLPPVRIFKKKLKKINSIFKKSLYLLRNLTVGRVSAVSIDVSGRALEVPGPSLSGDSD